MEKSSTENTTLIKVTFELVGEAPEFEGSQHSQLISTTGTTGDTVLVCILTETILLLPLLEHLTLTGSKGTRWLDTRRSR